MRLSIIIVNWRSCEYLRQCVRSIGERGGLTAGFEVIVVDNASFDGSGEMLAREFPAVRFVQSPRNEGFGRANNLGYEISTGRSLLFLNPDTEILDGALETMVKALETLPQAGIVGAKLLNDDRTLQTSCVQSFPSLWNQMMDAEALRRRFPNASMWGTEALALEGAEAVPVEVISGACLLIKRQVFEAVGLFSTDYFMYSEDVDLCFKSVTAGCKNYYVPEAVVVHYGGRSSDEKPESGFATVMTRESQRLFFQIRRGPLQAWLYQLSMGTVALGRLALIGGIVMFTLGCFRGTAMRFALRKWYRVLRWSLGLETWAKNPA